MPKQSKTHKAITILTDAIWHCQYGSDPEYIRTPDAGDIAAEGILRELKKILVREDIERDIIEGRT